MMATFDLNDFIKQPSAKTLDYCWKDDLFVIPQHYEISVPRALLKKDLKACLQAGLIDKGVLPDAEVMQQGEPSVADPGESPVAPVTPLLLTMPTFELLSILLMCQQCLF